MATVGGKLFYTSNSKRFTICAPTANFQRYWKNSHSLKRELWVPVPPAARPRAQQLQELHAGPLFFV